MVTYYGDFPVNHTSVVIPFNAFTSNDPSASATITDFANTDVHIHKNGSLTQRSSAAGVAIDIDVDGITGGHWVTIDLSDNTDAGFYAAGAEISVRIEGVTIDGATVNAFIGAFSIERAGGVLALLKAGTVDVNTKTITAGAIAAASFTAGAIDAAAIKNAAIDNATFAADVGSTAYATNIIALAAKKAVDEYDPPTKAELDTAQGAVVVSAAGIDAIFDRASALTVSFETLITRIYQILNNPMTVDETTGAISLKAIGGLSEIATGDVDSAAGVTDRDELTWA